jgi:hypothetical protein
MTRSNEKLFKVVENDRMFRKQKTVAARLLQDEAIWIQSMRYQGDFNDPWMQYAIEAEITLKWGEDV